MIEREFLFSKDAVITRVIVSFISTVPTPFPLYLAARHELSLHIGSQTLLSGKFAPFLFFGPFTPKVFLPVKAGQRLYVSWNVPPGKAYLTFAYREGRSGEEKETFFYTVAAPRRDGVTLLQPNIQKNYLWQGLFLYDSDAVFLSKNEFPQPGFPEIVFPGIVLPRIAPEPSLPLSPIDDVVQVRDFPTEFLLDYLPVSSLGGRGPAHFFREPIEVSSQTVLNIGVVSKTKAAVGTVTAMVLGTHIEGEKPGAPNQPA